MKKLLMLAALSMAVAGCSTTGAVDVKSIQIPNLPSELSVKARALPKLTDPTMGAIISDATDTDVKYNDVSIRYNNLIDFYNCIKESINQKKEMKCL